jgi:hypothetical protein
MISEFVSQIQAASRWELEYFRAQLYTSEYIKA